MMARRRGEVASAFIYTSPYRLLLVFGHEHGVADQYLCRFGHPIPDRLVPAMEVRRGHMVVEGRLIAIDLEEKDPCLVGGVLYHIEAQAAVLVTDGAARIVQRR